MESTQQKKEWDSSEAGTGVGWRKHLKSSLHQKMGEEVRLFHWLIWP